MITLATARRLKAAGLHWEPAQGDRFAVPERGMDDRVFVINDMATIIEMIQGAEMVTFHGTPEWALDYVYLGEAVWLPDEGQVRELLHQRLMQDASAGLRPALSGRGLHLPVRLAGRRTGVHRGGGKRGLRRGAAACDENRGVTVNRWE